MTAKNAILEEELLKPYEPIVYAIPQDQWETMCSLMKNCVDFQPQIAASLTTLATKQDATKIGTKLQDYTDWTLIQQRKHLAEMQSVMRNYLTEERKKLEQAGKENEQNGKQTASEVRESVGELSNKLRSMWKVALGMVIGSAALSSLL